MTNNIYLDYAATTPLDKDVLKAMLPLLEEEFGNPDSPHAHGRRAAYSVSEARDRIASVLGVSASEVYFTSGGTEADNWAVRMLGEGSVVVSAVEHAAVLKSAELRESAAAAANKDGLVTSEAVARAFQENTGLVALMAANNETGSIQPLKEVSALCRERGALLFSDCVQAAACLDLKEIVALTDAISLSGHKIYGPKGTGVLVVKKGVRLRPLIVGGEQEHSLRGGTTNAAGAVGFSVALEKAQREREAFATRVKKIRDRFEEILLAKLGDRMKIDGVNRLPNISHITFKKEILNKLDLAGLSASGGAACSAHSPLPSHVMLAMGRTAEEAKRGVRFSFGKDTSEEEATRAAEIVLKVIL